MYVRKYFQIFLYYILIINIHMIWGFFGVSLVYGLFPDYLQNVLSQKQFVELTSNLAYRMEVLNRPIQFQDLILKFYGVIFKNFHTVFQII